MRSADGEVPEFDGLVVASGHDVEVVELEAGDSVGVRSGTAQMCQVDSCH